MKVIIKFPKGWDWETVAWVVVPPSFLFFVGFTIAMFVIPWPGCT